VRFRNLLRLYLLRDFSDEDLGFEFTVSLLYLRIVILLPISFDYSFLGTFIGGYVTLLGLYCYYDDLGA
jgi:hypothetical protein